MATQKKFDYSLVQIVRDNITGKLFEESCILKNCTSNRLGGFVAWFCQNCIYDDVEILRVSVSIISGNDND